MTTPKAGAGSAAKAAAANAKGKAPRGEDDPVLPSVSRDETDEGWGDEPRGRDDEWYRRERPPHHE